MTTLLTLALLLAPVPPPPDGAPPDFNPGVLPAAAAVVPGLLVGGSGHFVAGDRDTAGDLLLIKSTGLGVLVTGVVVLAVTGASRRIVAPVETVTYAGAGAFGLATFADLYGALTGGTSGRPASIPDLQLSLGHRYIEDPLFAYRHFAHATYDARTPGLRRLRLHGELWHAVDDENTRAHQDLAWRFFDGPSWLELRGGLVHHDHESDGFALWGGDLAVGGRLDLRRLSPTMRGAFAEAELGLNLTAWDYHVPGLEFGEDVTTQLLARFAMGVWICDRAEIEAFYDHRHDDFAAGFSMPGIGVGNVGHVGLAGRVNLFEGLGLAGELQYGSALVAGLDLTYAFGGAP